MAENNKVGRAEWQQLVSVPSSVSCGRLTRAGGSLPPHADKLVLPVGFSPHGPHLGGLASSHMVIGFQK